jgi:hypothetical protein
MKAKYGWLQDEKSLWKGEMWGQPGLSTRRRDLAGFTYMPSRLGTGWAVPIFRAVG